MGSVPFPVLEPAGEFGAAARPAELDDVDYLREALLQPTVVTEADVDRPLFARAAALDLAIPPSRPTTADKPDTAGAESAVTAVSQHARTASTGSDGSVSTGLTSNHSLVIPATLTETAAHLVIARQRSHSLNFSHYDKYLSQVDPHLSQPKFLNVPYARPARTTSLFSVSTRRSIKGLGQSITARILRRPATELMATVSCSCCREDFSVDHHATQTLPCGHTYCQNCLAVMINQSTTDESKMPPRCCTQPIPGHTVKNVLSRDDQQLFLQAVLQYSTPWESRLFCPNSACGEFVPPHDKINPRHPSEVVCKNCKTRVCVMCKRKAHRFGPDCPSDWELEAVLRMGEKSGWRRCYKCRTLVELHQGCTHMTCRCKAQFCYICGAVWDVAVGCPNFCRGEEELERRRVEEEERAAEREAEKQARAEAAAKEEAERQEAQQRTDENASFRQLRKEQEENMARFQTFERKAKWIMWTRHSQEKLRLVEQYADLMNKMKERHDKTAQQLEDGQIEGEIELRHALDQQEKSIRIKLKHMEAYCNALGRNPGKDMPSRQVTQKHLELLGQQYHVRDGMERRHQAQINVLREKQAKRLEELMDRQERELDTLAERRGKEVDELTGRCATEDEAFARTFAARRARMRRRWLVQGEILRHELETRHQLRFAPMRLPEWPADRDDLLATRDEDGLAVRDVQASTE
ncbi:hypothetical protein P8C59_001083 [Phyllachora maydis]|uniref:RBR-type E3 ubiquitin transferase n=1 Tax=Phyllachora maydis TaxID=1825666 RepID=A0AAD9HZ06_9PEZI|nr:hypothetical protein P8C59_001083 [Phyllachora maydis]